MSTMDTTKENKALFRELPYFHKSSQIKSNHWFIVPFAVRRLNCRIPFNTSCIYIYIYILISYIHWQDWYLPLTKVEKRSILVAMSLLELPDLEHTLVDIGTTLLCISGYNGLPGRILPTNLIHDTARRSERVDTAALSSASSYEIPGQMMERAVFVRSQDSKQDT